LARKSGPGLALAGAPSAAQLDQFKTLMDGLLQAGGAGLADLQGLGLGVHGVDFEDETALQKRSLAGSLGLSPDKVTLVNDGVVALWGASPSPCCAIVQHGSGITGAYRSALGQEQRFDHLNIGGLFDLRVEAVKTARRMLDGRLPATPLLGKIEASFGVRGKRAFSDAAYRGQLPRQALARVALLVFEAWAEGDPAATVLVRQAVEDYAASALAMAKLSGATELYFGGGVIASAPPAFWTLLRESLHQSLPGAVAQPPRLGPDAGACLLAGFYAGLDLPSLWARLEGVLSNPSQGVA
jgi:N-acetylglucosamine kinase-like BadF-type ATPase